MAERKVQSKYVPADFDHRVLKAVQSKEPKRRNKAKNEKKETVRVMLPFNVRCSKCDMYMYRGRKFNGRKEEGVDPDYLGTKIIRFYIKCETCSNPIVFRTDPKTAGFAMVSGATENKTTAGYFNPLAGVVEKDEIPKDSLDPVASLEARALETKREMEVIAELEREMKRSQARTAVFSERMVSEVAKNQNSETNGPDLDDSEVVQTFNQQRRLLQYNNDLQPAISQGNLDKVDKSDSAEEFDDAVTVVRKKVSGDGAPAKKPKLTSLVTYDDDD